MAKRSSHIIQNRSFDMTQQEAACLSNVVAETLLKWEKEENPPPRNPDGTYPARDFGLWMMRYQTKKRGPGAQPTYPFAPVEKLRMPEISLKARTVSGNETKNDAEIRRTSAQADKIEMENKVAAGLLVPLDEIEPALAEMVTKVKNRLLKIPVALSPLVLGDDDLYSIQQKLRDGVNDALSEVSVEWKSGIVENDDE